ncbi:MAG: hypothetical protein KJO21_03815 [Verrucomicrobiae bacterium]|nr:hypothetical protein [Verrucomicrobiae bacterium]NNJ42626.1 hypothetical protein [Akkermansiaceae bacterium]
MIKYGVSLGACALVAACGSSGVGGTATSGGDAVAGDWKKVAGVTHAVTGNREVMKAKVDGGEVVAMLVWRDYSAALDGAISKWYGDMATPPPKFVVESLMISIDGKGMIIPQAKSRYLASQWMNGLSHLGINQRGEQLRVLVDVGDGAEGWTATYVVNAQNLSLISHEVRDGAEVHNEVVE